MKTRASISVMLSFLAAFASAGTLAGATSDAASDASLSAPPAITAPKDVIGAPHFLPPHPNLSRCSTEVLQLTHAGMDESVVMSFINGSGLFQLSAEHIVYLNDLGVPAKVIQAMLAHDRESLGKLPQTTNAAANVAVSVPTEQERIATSEEKPATMEVAATIVEAAPQRTTEARVNHPAAMQADSDVAKLNLQPQKNNPRRSAPAKRRVLYPVREPHPVELTAPIVFLDAPTF